MLHILLCNDRTGPQSKALVRALRSRGAKVTTAPLTSLEFDSGAPHGLSIPGFACDLPDCVLVRSIAAGSFEAITRRLGILHALEKLGVTVWNSATAIERCVDKSMTTFLLGQSGLPTPRTFAVEGIEAAQRIVVQENTTLVLKPLFGAQGRGLRRIRTIEDLPPKEAVNDTYYLQHYVQRDGPPFHDYRALVCAGRVVALMRRRSSEWISNVSLGAIPEAIDDAQAGELAPLAVEAARAVGAEFAGVDLVRDQGGKLFVLEVNSMPAWSGLQSVVKCNISDAIAEGLVSSLGRSRPLQLISGTAP